MSMLSDDCRIYSLELIVQDLIRKYNLGNGSEAHHPIPVTELINAILLLINDGSTEKSREIRDIFVTCGLCDPDKSVWGSKLMGWLKFHPSFTIIGDMVGFSGKDCAHQQLEEMFIQLILNENPENGILPLQYFVNLLNHMFSANEYNEYQYQLFSNCGFLKFETKQNLPTKVLSHKSIFAWIRANTKLGVLSTGGHDYVVIFDEPVYGAANTRVQHDIQRRADDESDFLERLKETLKGKGWMNYPSLGNVMAMPKRGFQGVSRTVQQAMNRGEPFDMKKGNNEWYFSLLEGNERDTPQTYPLPI